MVQINRRDVLRRGLQGGMGLTALGMMDAFTSWTQALASSEQAGTPMSQLVAAAKKEGALNVIALPPDWANYGQILSTFQTRYGLKITSANPDGSSAQEVQTIQSLKGQNRGPDVVDVSPAFAAIGMQKGLYAPYKVATWSSIPDFMKDPAGNWYGDYWGVESFISVNSQVKQAPQDWSDLLSPKLRGMVSIDGDPRQTGDAFGAVMAAALGNGGSVHNIQPGVDFFAKLKKAGNFNPTDGLTANIAKGVTPIVIKWDYLSLAVRDELAKTQPTTVTVPQHGVYGGYYCQAVSKFAPNPSAARLWQEFLYSDEGQLLFLKGYTHPARYLDLAKHGKVPAALAAKLPNASLYAKVQFANKAEITAASAILAEQWGPKVAGA